MSSSKQRPKVVTVISWLIILKGAWLFFPTFSLLLIQSYSGLVFEETHGRALSPTFHITWSLIGALARWTAAGLMLSGIRVGCLLYVSYIPAAFAVSVWLFGIHARDVVSAVIFAIFAILLFRRPAADFFSGRSHPNTTANT